MFVNGPPGTGDGRLKIIDLGTAIKHKPGRKVCDVYGSPNYMAPEVTKGWYGNKADCFSVGVIMFMLIFNKTPFNGASDADVLDMI